MAIRPAPKPVRRRHFIKEWRTFRGLSQEQLAERIGKTHSLVSQLERNLLSYTSDTLEALADALNTETWQLLNVDPFKEGEVVDLMEILRKASPELRREILGYARGRAEN